VNGQQPYITLMLALLARFERGGWSRCCLSCSA